MRAFCTVSAPLEVCALPTRPLSPGSRFLALRLLGTPQPRTLYFLVEAKSRVREVYAQTCLHFAKQGMLDTELFGLAVLIDGEYMFADPESKLSKYGPKSWRSSHTHGLDANGRPLLELHFRVQFYIESPFMLRDETSRHNYYLQLKSNAVSRDVPREYSEQSMIMLGGLALQADIGDCPDEDIAESSTSLASGSGGDITNSNSTNNDPITLNSKTNKSSTNCNSSNNALSGSNNNVNSTNLSNALGASGSMGSGSVNTAKGNGIIVGGYSLSSKTSSVTSLATTASSSIMIPSTSTSCTNSSTAISINNTSNNNSSSNTSDLTIAGAAGTVVTNASSTSSSSLKTETTSPTNVEYFRIEEYLPVNLRSSWDTSALRSCHREHRGMSKSDAELNYIRQACSLHDAINAHVYRMKMSKSENGPGSIWFGIYAKGIRIYGENTQPITFSWPNIIKLSFERKKFEIRSGDNKITLYSNSDEKNKMLLALSKETHQFSMKISARLKEAIKREEEESSSLHTCYIYSRSLNMPYKNKNDQRISVISSTSSNTTSGIVSDRVHSEDELEIMINTPPTMPMAAPSTESLALAHLLDGRPNVSRQTSSVGQVSLKDLEDHFAAMSAKPNKNRSISNESTGASSAGSGCGGGSAVGRHGNDSSELNVNSEQLHKGNNCVTGSEGVGDDSNDTDSPNSQHNIGSQCSSTCSTVVVATDTITLSSFSAHASTGIRRPSTSSSLELGFSHTAQNSALSEGASTFIDHEYMTNNDNEGETASAVYALGNAPPTETSGVYTMNSSEMTGQSSEIAESESHESSHYGSFQPKSELGEDSMENIDSVDGQFRNRLKSTNVTDFRLRSDSNISASGSFRGDGSDPTDNKHNLLSAEELTDLIVGRGTYPSRKSVSATLHSDCDYVTLPLPLEGDSYLQGHQDTAPTEDNVDIDDMMPSDPPAPPKRIDSNMHRSLSSLVDIRMRSPPPYNARHEKTGLCGPPVRKVSLQTPVPLRDPPPYPKDPVTAPSVPFPAIMSTPPAINNNNNNRKIYLKKSKTSNLTTAVPGTPLSEEVTARFITTRPHINILKAHTSVINENTKPSYAAPTIAAMTNVPHNITHSTTSHSQVSSQLASVPSTIGIPVVPYGIHTSHKSMSSIPPPPPYPDMKTSPRTCVLLPVIKPRQYLPPPPPTIPRQPPPPPPAQLASVYTSQLARSQIELYQQQLYSDVDYVIYPLQDPAVSQQEYLDAKQGSILAAMAQSPPPPPYLAYHSSNPHTNTWDTCKSHALYRSTPYLPMALSTTHSRYASTQNLSDTYVQLPGAYSPLYSPSVGSLCSSYEPPPPPPLRPTSIPTQTTMFSRSRSDDNILNSIDPIPKMKRLPPPPPPLYQERRLRKPPIPTPVEKPPPIPVKPSSTHYLHSANSLGNIIPTGLSSPSGSIQQYRQKHQKSQSSALNNSLSSLSYLQHNSNNSRNSIIQNNTAFSTSSSNKSILSSINKNRNNLHQSYDIHNQNQNSNPIGESATNSAGVSQIDIQILREKSKHMDLPLISALCNDRSLLKQTKAFVMPKHPRNISSSSIGNNGNNTSNNITTATNSNNNNGNLTMNNNNTSTNLNSSNNNQQQSNSTVNNSSSNNSNTNSSSSNNNSINSTVKSKYPVSGLSTTQLAKPRKTSISHRHPNDKLPPLPVQTAEANNYVMDPTPASIKHKSYNSQSNS